MMKKKKLILWTCLISISILVILFCGLSKFSKEKTYPVFLLTQDVSSGCKIEKDMIRSVFIPESCNLPSICKRKEDIVDKILACDIKEGDILSLQDLSTSENTDGYPSIAQGKFLYTLALKAEDANGWWIKKGNEIDMLVYDATVTSMDPIQWIESVKIIRIMDESGNETLQDGEPPKMVCLELSNEQAHQLFQAENGKKIKIIAKSQTN